jgi:hypothetical protein
VGSASIGSVLGGVTRLAIDATRDVNYSYDPLTPYFLVTGARLTLSQRIGGPFDLIAVGGRDYLQYQSLLGTPVGGRTDRTQVVGGGVGLHLGSSLRFTLIADLTQRVSNAPDRRVDYRRRRVLASTGYGW